MTVPLFAGSVAFNVDFNDLDVVAFVGRQDIDGLDDSACFHALPENHSPCRFIYCSLWQVQMGFGGRKNVPLSHSVSLGSVFSSTDKMLVLSNRFELCLPTRYTLGAEAVLGPAKAYCAAAYGAPLAAVQ